MGPGHGLQLRTGRLLMPYNHALSRDVDPRVRYVSHAMYSDDHGKTWKVGADVGPDTNECSLAELRQQDYNLPHKTFLQCTLILL